MNITHITRPAQAAVRRFFEVSTALLLLTLQANAQIDETETLDAPGWQFITSDWSAPALDPGAPPPPPPESAAAAVLPGTWLGTVNADASTVEIQELAQGLQFDPLKIFNFVRNHISYEHYYGCKKGAALTLLEKAGNDFDQCSLLVSLLRWAANHDPNTKIGIVDGADRGAWVKYEYGMMSIPQTSETLRDVTHWLGTSDFDAIQFATWFGGWPYLKYYSTSLPLPQPDAGTVYAADHTFIARVCVKAYIDGAWRLLDPSFKICDDIAGLNSTPANDQFNVASLYDKAALLDAAGPPSASHAEVSGIVYANLRSYLNTLSGNLASWFKATPQRANASMDQIIGGRRIVPVQSTDYSSTHYFDWLLNHTHPLTHEVTPCPTPVTWDQIPGDRASTIQITSGATFNWFVPLATLGGRRVSITFSQTDSKAQIWLDDDLKVTESVGSISGNTLPIETKVFHPYRTLPTGFSANGTDSSTPVNYQRTATIGDVTFPCVYAVAYTFTPTLDFVRSREKILATYKADNRPDSSRMVRSETLNIMGLQWFLQMNNVSHLFDQASGTTTTTYHGVARVGQEQGFYIDSRLLGTYSRTNVMTAENLERTKRARDLSTFMVSALEHGVVEQLQGGEAVSTVRLIKRALNAGGTVKRVVSGTSTIIRPEVASQTVGNWSGTGLARYTGSNVKMLISGKLSTLNGGFGTSVNYVTSTQTMNGITFDPYVIWANPASQFPNFTNDPIDLATGSLVYDHEDLAIGGAEPRGLHFSRHYNSGLRLRDDTGLGYGWTHNLRIQAATRSDAGLALGEGTPEQAAAALTSIHAALDLYDSSDTKKTVCSMLALGWAIDNIPNNTVSVQIGERTLQFYKQLDGTYLPPSGMSATLSLEATGYKLAFRHGNVIFFDGHKRAARIVDQYGNELNFYYHPTTGVLTTVTDCYSRYLQFGYSGGNLISIQDGPSTKPGLGRIVHFAQDANGDLTTCTDPEGKVWSFGYLSGHRLEQTLDPENRIIAKNIYDSLNRVRWQDTEGNTEKRWTMFYSPNATVEMDPLGGRKVYYYDDRHRLTAEEDAVGHVTKYEYDAHDRRISVATPLAEKTSTSYDEANNPTLITDPLQYTAQFVYDSNDSNERLDHIIDRRNHTTNYTFNSFDQPWTITSPEGVQTELLYYTTGPHRGLIFKKIVEATYTTTYSYDSNGFVNLVEYPNQLSESFQNNARGDVISHTNLNGNTTSFQYNNRRQLKLTYLPIVNGVTYFLETVYDDSGNAWKSYDRYRNLTTQTYSATGKPLVTTLSDGETVTSEYDKRDWLVATRDHRGTTAGRDFNPDGSVSGTYDHPSGPVRRQRSTRTYDENGRSWKTSTPMPNAAGGFATNEILYTVRGEVWKAIAPANPPTIFGYDENGNLTTRKNRRGNTWQFTYNNDDQLVDTFSPMGGKLERLYDGRGLLHTVEEPSGQLTTYTPDTLGRVNSLVDAVGQIAFDYDGEGRLNTVQENTSGSPLIDRDYDALGRMTRYQHGSDYTLQWIYLDADPNNKNAFILRYPGSVVKDVRYDFDQRGRLKTVKDWNNRTTTYNYDNLGRLEWTIRPNGTQRHVRYDDAGQISKIEELNIDSRVIALFSYPSYWDNGQPRQEFSVPASPPGIKIHAAAMTFNDDDRVVTWNNQTVFHDPDGNMTSGPLPSVALGLPGSGFGSFVYDARNRLTSVSSISSPPVITGYKYDAENLRVKVTTSAGDTQWVMNSAGSLPQPLVRTRPDGTITRYVWGLGLLYEEEELPLHPTKTYHYDRRGSTVALSSDNGRTVSDRWTYGPYGEALSRTGTSDTPFQFNGFFGVQTDPTGLLYMNARYYNTELRRFISSDPMRFGAGSNFYAFASGDPFSLADPFGLCACDAGQGRFDRFMSGFNSGFTWENAAIGVGFGIAAVFVSPAILTGAAIIGGGAAIYGIANADDPWHEAGQLVGSAAAGAPGAAFGSFAANAVRAGFSEVAAEIAPKWFITCFPRGTKVETPKGKVSIEDVKKGDLVLARDAEGKVVARKVLQLVCNSTSHWMKIRVGGETIKTTGGHPFWVIGRGWTHARDLRSGMLLQSFNGSAVKIESVEKVKLVSPEETFNFEVEELHNYFAGTGHLTVLTHNVDPFDVAFSRNPMQISTTDVFGHGPLQGTTLGQAVEQAATTGQLPAGLKLEGNFINDLSHPMGGYWQTANNRTLWVAQEAGLMNVDVADTNGAFKTIQNHVKMSDGGTFFRQCPE